MAREIKPARPVHTVSADLIRGLIECAGKCGIASASIANALGESLAAGATRYSSVNLFRLWEQLVRVSGDPVIGFRMARFAEPRHFGALGQILPRCGTVIEAFRQVERFSSIVYQGTRVSITRNDSSLVATIASDLPSGAAHTNGMLWMLSTLSGLPSRMTGQAIGPSRVLCDFAAPGPAASRALRERWPITFKAGVNRILFDRAVGNMRIPTADAELKTLLGQLIEQRLGELTMSANFEQSLAHILRRMMNGTMPTLSALSKHAGMSRRTLQRRLAGSNLSFQELLRNVLRESADKYLARGVSQSEIAFLLGYSEQSAFSRAYRSWTGTAPGTSRGKRLAKVPVANVP